MGQGGEQARGWGGRLRREAEEGDVQLWPRDKHPRTSCTRPCCQWAEGRANKALGSLGPGSVGKGTQWWEEAWAQGGVLVHCSDGLSLVHVLQQQVHSLRKVVHVPISLYLWMMLIAGPGRQSRRLV